MRWVYRRLKSKRDENLRKHVGFANAYVKKAKIKNLMMRKVATSRKSKRYGLIDNEKQDSFRFVSVCDFQDDLSPAIAKILAQGLQGYNSPAD